MEEILHSICGIGNYTECIYSSTFDLLYTDILYIFSKIILHIASIARWGRICAWRKNVNENFGKTAPNPLMAA